MHVSIGHTVTDGDVAVNVVGFTADYDGFKFIKGANGEHIAFSEVVARITDRTVDKREYGITWHSSDGHVYCADFHLGALGPNLERLLDATEPRADIDPTEAYGVFLSLWDSSGNATTACKAFTH